MAIKKTKAGTNAAIATKKAKAKTKAPKLKTKKSKKKKKVKVSPFGAFGKQISFMVSSSKVLTFEALEREGEARWKKHEVIKGKPRMQFLGPGNDTITMTIILDARHGVKPRGTIEKIITYRDKGRADYLVIKGKKVGKNKFVITKSSDTWDEIWNKGELVRATLELTLQECR